VSGSRSLRLGMAWLAVAVLAGCASGSQPTRSHFSSVERGYYKIGEPYMVDGVLYTPAEDWNYDETGIASWYGPDFHGKRTANGELYDMNQVTGAHKTLPMPCLVRVTNLDNGRAIVVRVNDRGPFSRGRILDLSRRAAQLLGFERIGTAKVRVQILAAESQALAEAARQGRLGLGDLAGLDADALPPEPPPIAQTVAVPTQRAAAPPAPVYPEDQRAALVAMANEGAAIEQDAPATKVKGSTVDGRFLPAPQFTQQKVKPSNIYIQAGTFSVMANAERLRNSLDRVARTDISPLTIKGKPFYRVRVGPIGSVDEADQLLSRVVGVGASDARIIVD